MQVVPGLIVFRSADPRVEVGVKPGAWGQRMQQIDIAVARDCLRDRKRLDGGIVLQSFVEAPQKFASRLGVILPGVFAVQNDWDDSIFPLTRYRSRRVLNVMD